jgi:hypothetical protein
MTFQLGLISLVVAALAAAAAIVSIAALGRQARYGNVTGAVGAHDAAFTSYDKAGARAPCPDPGCGVGSYK